MWICMRDSELLRDIRFIWEMMYEFRHTPEYNMNLC